MTVDCWLKAELAGLAELACADAHVSTLAAGEIGVDCLGSLVFE